MHHYSSLLRFLIRRYLFLVIHIRGVCLFWVLLLQEFLTRILASIHIFASFLFNFFDRFSCVILFDKSFNVYYFHKRLSSSRPTFFSSLTVSYTSGHYYTITTSWNINYKREIQTFFWPATELRHLE